MSHPLRDIDHIDEDADSYVHRIGDVFACFGTNTQDSGNISYGVRVEGTPHFVKTTGVANSPLAGPASPTHKQRIGLLRNATAVAQSVDHPALPALQNVIESPGGPLLVYEWVDGDLLGSNRNMPDAPLTRFRQLPINDLLAAINTIYDVLGRVARAGWITEDFYDGCVIYDFDTADLHLVDLDHCHRGPFTNTMGQMFGSTRFMAPEEFERGAWIDHRTASFLMGRIASIFLSDNTLDRDPFRGSNTQYGVIRKACQESPADRYQTEDAFLNAWSSSGIA